MYFANYYLKVGSLPCRCEDQICRELFIKEDKLSSDKKENSFKFIVIPLLFLLVIFCPLSGHLFPARLWGMHHLCFYPFYFCFILTLLTLSVFVPKINNIWLGLFQGIFGQVERFLSRFNRYVVYAGASFISFFIFWFLRTRLHLLGDGYLKLRLLPQGKIGMAEWLNDVIHVQFFYLLSSRLEWWTPELTYASISIFCGGLFVFVVLCLLDLLGKNNFEKVFLGSMIFSLASVELFFGYVEAYTMFNLALITYAFLSVLYLKGRLSIFFPLGALILSSLLHVFGLVLVPSFLFLLWQDKKINKRFILKPTYLLSLTFLISVIVFKAHQVFSATSGFHRKMMFVPLVSKPEYDFSMFCCEHFLEFFNQILLISPVGMILFLFFIKDTFLSKDKITIFFLVGAVFSLGFIFVFNSMLGTADWDIRSFPGVFFVPTAAIIFNHKAGGWRYYRNFGLILIFFSFFHLIPWILLHTDQKRSIEHYKLVQLCDPHPQDYANYNAYKIARNLEYAGYGEEVEKVYRDAIEKDPQDERNYYNLAKICFDRHQKYPEAESLLVKAITLEPKYFWAHFLLGKIYQIWGELDKAAYFYFKSIPILFDNPKFIKNLSAIYLELGRLEGFGTYLENVAASNPHMMEANRNLGYVRFLMQDYKKAQKEFEMALRLKPDDEFSLEYLERLKRMGY